MIAENIASVRRRIAAAAERAARKGSGVRLVAVTKNVPVEKILEAAPSVDAIGENRVQESQDKFQAIHAAFPTLQWHLIGQLQRNKVNRALELFDCVQSLDSEKLARAVDRRAGELGKVQDCLVELKVSGEPTKSGLPPADLEPFIDICRNLQHLRVRGLMTIAPNFDDREQVRPYLSEAKRLFDEFFVRHPASPEQPILSMGMSQDFEIAVEEGSTMVRVGTAIFGSRPAKAG